MSNRVINLLIQALYIAILFPFHRVKLLLNKRFLGNLYLSILYKLKFIQHSEIKVLFYPFSSES